MELNIEYVTYNYMNMELVARKAKQDAIRKAGFSALLAFITFQIVLFHFVLHLI